MFNDFANKAFRDAFVEENVRTGIAFQIRALREDRPWTQAELAEVCDKPTSVISRLENPDYGRYTLRSLFELASAFDVALLVKFVSYSRLLTEIADLSPQTLAVASYEKEKNGRAAITARDALLGQGKRENKGSERPTLWTPPPISNQPDVLPFLSAGQSLGNRGAHSAAGLQ